MDGLLWFCIGIVIFLALIFACTDFVLWRVWCWNSRVQLDATFEEIQEAIGKWKEIENEIKEKTPTPLVGGGKQSSLKRDYSEIIDEESESTVQFLQRDEEPILNEELKKDKDGYYVEKKWLVTGNTKAANFFLKIWNNLLNNSITWSFIGLVVIVLTTFLSNKLSASFIKGIETYIIAFVGLFSVLISLLFTNGIEKNKENKRLFDALCGDIKGLAMYTSALMTDKNIYDFEIDNEGEQNEVLNRMDAKQTYEIEAAKIRLLLSVLAPVAKHVLRDSPSKRPGYNKLDDKYRLKVYYPYEPSALKKCCLKGYWPPKTVEDHSQTWGKLKEQKDKANKNEIKIFLYEKIKFVSERSGMDLFECIMYILLDTINGLSELEFITHYGKERDLITKWQHIYASWGTMSSLTSYTQPLVVHVTIILSLFIYMWGITALNVHEAWVNFYEVDTSGNDWVDEKRGEDYFYTYIVIKSILQIFPFTWFWFLSKRIGKPFKKGYPDAEVISKVCRNTQKQVSSLMTNRADIDAFDKGRQQKLYTACDRPSLNCGSLWVNPDFAKKVSEFERSKMLRTMKKKTVRRTKNRRRSRFNAKAAAEALRTEGNPGKERVLELPDSGIQRRKVRYKNVNF